MVVKNQHYVWRDYLQNWSYRSDIVFFIRDGDLKETNVRNLASKRFFYKLDNLNENDVFIIDNLFTNNTTPDYLRSLQQNWSSIFVEMDKLLKYGEDNLDCNSEEYKEFINFRKDFDEVMLSRFEGPASKYYKKLLVEEMDFLSNDDNRAEFLIFIAIQLLRTKKMKRVFVDSLRKTMTKFMKEHKVHPDSIWSVLKYKLSTNIANSLYLDNYKFILLKANSEVPFITTDQPIINCKAEEGVIPSEMELYYPLSPKLALLITLDTEYSNMSKVELNSESTHKYNELLYNNRDAIVISNNQEYLEKLVNKI